MVSLSAPPSASATAGVLFSPILMGLDVPLTLGLYMRSVPDTATLPKLLSKKAIALDEPEFSKVVVGVVGVAAAAVAAATVAVGLSEFQLDRFLLKLKKSESRSASKVDGEVEEGDEDKDGVEVERGDDDAPFVRMDKEEVLVELGVTGSLRDEPIGDVGVKESSNSKVGLNVALGVANPLPLTSSASVVTKSSSKESSNPTAAKLFLPNPQASSSP